MLYLYSRVFNEQDKQTKDPYTHSILHTRKIGEATITSPSGRRASILQDIHLCEGHIDSSGFYFFIFFPFFLQHHLK